MAEVIKMERFDIVYILKEDIEPAELTYSLRSVEQNFPHNKVWFVGSGAKGLQPDGSIYHRQVGATKWERVHSSFEQIIKCEDITKKFFLFNDDFFVLDKIDTAHFVNTVGGTLEKRVRDLKNNIGGTSLYCRSLADLRQELLINGYDVMSFALHIPILLDKRKMANVLGKFNSMMFRSAYGNYTRESYIYHPDVKIYDRENIPLPSWDYCSTTEDSFKNGKVGEFIRERFTKPSRFEDIPSPSITELYTEEGDIIHG